MQQNNNVIIISHIMTTDAQIMYDRHFVQHQIVQMMIWAKSWNLQNTLKTNMNTGKGKHNEYRILHCPLPKSSHIQYMKAYRIAKHIVYSLLYFSTPKHLLWQGWKKYWFDEADGEWLHSRMLHTSKSHSLVRYSCTVFLQCRYVVLHSLSAIIFLIVTPGCTSTQPIMCIML